MQHKTHCYILIDHNGYTYIGHKTLTSTHLYHDYNSYIGKNNFYSYAWDLTMKNHKNTWKNYFRYPPLMLRWKALKTHITTWKIIYVGMDFINTHIHSIILQTLLFHHLIFELSFDLHLKCNRLLPSLMNLIT